MEADTHFVQEDKKKFDALLRWLNETRVIVRELYVGDSEQPIRNLFNTVGLYYPLVVKFIEYRKNKGRKFTLETVYLMNGINAEMKEEFEKRPRNEAGIVIVASDSYKDFVKHWKERVEKLYKLTNNDEFLESYLQSFFGLFSSRDDIWFDVKQLENFTLLCSKIAQLNDLVLDQLYETYNNPKYNELYERSYKGGRKLSRRRKSNPKTKSKHNKRRRSYKKSSHRRQRH